MINYLAGVHTHTHADAGQVLWRNLPWRRSLSSRRRLPTQIDKRINGPQTNSLWIIHGAKFSLLPIAIKSHLAGRKTRIPCSAGIWMRESRLSACRNRTWGFGGACAVVLWRGPPPPSPPPHIPPSQELFTRLSRTQPAEHGPSAG